MSINRLLVMIIIQILMMAVITVKLHLDIPVVDSLVYVKEDVVISMLLN